MSLLFINIGSDRLTQSFGSHPVLFILLEQLIKSNSRILANLWLWVWPSRLKIINVFDHQAAFNILILFLCGYSSWIDSRCIVYLALASVIHLLLLSHVGFHERSKLYRVLCKNFIWLVPCRRLIRHKGGWELSSALRNFWLNVLIENVLLMFRAESNWTHILLQSLSCLHLWTLGHNFVWSSFHTDWSWHLSWIREFVVLVNLLTDIQRFFERLKLLKLWDLSLVEILNTFGSLSSTNLLIISKEKSSEILSLEKVSALILWFRIS